MKIFPWQRKQVALRADVNLKKTFTRGQRLALQQQTRMEGWEVFLDLFEEECLRALGAAIAADGDEQERRAMMMARAYSEAFVKVQERVAYEIGELDSEDAEPEREPATDEQRMIARTVSAVP